MGKKRIISFIIHELSSIKNKFIYKPGGVNIDHEIIEFERDGDKSKKAGEVVPRFREEILRDRKIKAVLQVKN